MIESHPQEALLIKFADQQASPAEQQQVRELIENDKTAASFLSQLQQTSVSLPDNTVSLPAANQSTIDLINDWQPQRSTVRSFGLKAMAATLVAGLATGYLLTTVIKAPFSATTESSQVTAAYTPEWIRLVADYHRLYARQTIEHSATPPIAVANAEVTDWLERDTSIPSLESHGIAFKLSLIHI